MLLDAGFPEFAASRAYYAMFYAASALLLSRGLRFKTHAALQSAFGREIAHEKSLPTELHEWLLDAAEARNIGDYRPARSISAEEASAHISRAANFVQVTADRFA